MSETNGRQSTCSRLNILNLLTRIRLHLYSDDMNADFHLLSEKISQLAEMAQTLRRENAELRRAIAAVASENADLSTRMDSAHERVTSLLAQMGDLEPELDAVPDEEAAA